MKSATQLLNPLPGPPIPRATLERIEPSESAKGLPVKLAQPFAPQAQAPGEKAESSRIFRFLTCGSVDDGKSTLIGRMLKDLGLVPQDTWEGVLAESERRNFSRDNPDYSLLLDGLLIDRKSVV